MKNSISKLMILGAFIICASEVIATDNIQKILDSNQNQVSIDSSVEFQKNEYVRITQPIIQIEEDFLITTFESEINMMGHARVGTKISITVYNGNEVYKTYELEEVGATQTFNQLVSLNEKDNTVVLTYTHKDIPNSTQELSTKIYRQPEENKLKIKNYVVSTPQDLPENLIETP
ncbi:hypothetical protein AN641_04095 [Candidatus Epulonipiscioides gigas]|nr:hypothetical protein AN641_04095 [Epulopiscium sp. SCG-C07WGA-EpuloA2]